MDEINKKISSLFIDMGCGQGINNSLFMTIFANLYMEPEPIPMENLAKNTGYSLASISNKVNMLGPLIQKTRKPGSKKLFLYMEKDILNIWKQALLKKEKYVIIKTKEKLPLIIKDYKKKAKTETDNKKIKILENYYDQILKFEKVIKKIIIELDKVN
ncbi:MAG: hypothetical protein ABIC04_08520 [Nanoarchaeota archaeon]